jgi:hypothetical protein
MTDLDPALLLAAYDTHLRARVPDPVPAGVTVDRDGPLIRILGLDDGGFVTYTDLGGLDGRELDALIARQRDHFAGQGVPVEWKLHGHDRPADLGDRLRAAGFRPQAPETVVIGPVAGLAATQPVTPEGVRLREVRARADLQRVARMAETVSGGSRDWLADGLEREIEADPQGLTVVVAEADARWSAPGGSGTSPGPGSPPCGAARRCRSGGARGSTGRWSRTVPDWLTPAASRCFRWTRPATAGPSWNASGSWRSPRPSRTSSPPAADGDPPVRVAGSAARRRPGGPCGDADARLARPSTGAEAAVGTDRPAPEVGVLAGAGRA